MQTKVKKKQTNIYVYSFAWFTNKSLWKSVTSYYYYCPFFPSVSVSHFLTWLSPPTHTPDHSFPISRSVLISTTYTCSLPDCCVFFTQFVFYSEPFLTSLSYLLPAYMSTCLLSFALLKWLHLVLCPILDHSDVSPALLLHRMLTSI